MAPPKRKRPDRQYSQDDGRPSPHRPDNLRLAHQQQNNHQQQNSPRGGGGGGGGGRRQSRPGGRGGSSVPQSPNVSHTSPTAMSPPTNAFQPTKPMQAAPSVAAPSNDQPSIPAPSRQVPESNEYLTSERVKRWNGQARDAVVQAALSAAREGDILTLSVVFHEIIEAAMDYSMGPGELGSIVRDIVAAPSGDDIDPIATFLDTLSSFTQDKNKQANIRQMLMATNIDLSRMRTELETDLLSSLGLVRDSFAKMAVRKATHALYRQSNYNLLREETEGYSKLMTEYFTTVNSEPPSQEVVTETYQRVNALIGAFDLDIGRVLDVTLDVFANLLVKHGKFFVKLLRSSAWWPELRGLDGIEWEEPEVATLPPWAQQGFPLWYCSDAEKEEQALRRERRDKKFWQRVGELGERAGIQAYFELGGRRIVVNNRQPEQTMPAEGAPLSKQQAARKWADEWIAQTGTLPPSGNDIAAQLLGFKLRFYASDARDASDFLPENLIYLAALLIKIGFISILDLYPHLYPLEEDMPAHNAKLFKAKKDKEEKERGAATVNALTLSGALPDENPHGAPTRSRETATKPDLERSTTAKSEEAGVKKSLLPEPADQKYQLLKSLLCIGALPEALFILGRHAWLLEIYPELLDFMIRLAHHSIGKVYEATRPIPADHIPMAAKGAALRTPSRPSDFIPRRTLRWAKPDMRDAGDGIDYKFYWEDWVDNVPVCQEVDDVVKFCTSFLGLLGPECGQDNVLLTKIVRIAKKNLADDPTDDNRKRWRDFSATFIAPALSFTGKNPGIINEAWALFKNFDTATRYTIYQQWFTTTKPASIRDTFEKTKVATNFLLSRVATKNTKEYGRKIAKISYSSPGVVFQLTLKRLINYPNMIDTLVECVKYLTLLGYDCLTWTLVAFFIRPEKGANQNDGMLSAPWLKNIASFVGKAHQKYSLMDPTPVLQYIAHQLLQSDGELYMLDVLEQMCKSMGGITIYDSLSESMTLSLCGGPILRTFTFQHQLADNRHLVTHSARRFVRCLKDTGLGVQILVALAQHVEAYIHRDDQEGAPDKVVLFNMDNLRFNLLQYVELLRTFLSVKDFDAIFPGPVEMIAKFDIAPDIAFTIARASVAYTANAARSVKVVTPIGSKAQSSDDVAVGGIEDKPTMNGSITSLAVEKDTSADVEMKESIEVDGSAHKGSLTSDRRESQDAPRGPNPAIEALAGKLRTELPDTFGEHPCVSFYITFWQLGISDVDSGGIKQQYENTIAHFERQLPAPVPERRGYNPNIPRRETDEQRRAKIEIAKLQVEEHEVTQANALTKTHLRAEMQHWFDGVPMMNSRSDLLHHALLQDCFLPRSRLSLEDAQYASSMLKFMHESGVPGFRTIKLLDCLFNANKLSCIISMYSVNEAQTFGRFINDIIRELQQWHQDKENAYVKSAHGADKKLPGFGRRFDAERNPIEHLQYTEFCSLLYKWHKALFTSLKTCVESGDFQQIRNSLSILTALSGSFPRVDTMARELQQSIQFMTDHDERSDIKTVATSSLSAFKKAEKDLQSEHKFRNLPEPLISTPATNGTQKATTEKPNTPQPQDSTARLNAGATAFKPKTETNGIQRALEEQPGSTGTSQPLPTTATSAPLSRDREPVKSAPQLNDVRSQVPSRPDRDPSKPFPSSPAPPHISSVPPRPEGRNTPQPGSVIRPAHVLPSRPDSQPPRARQPDRPNLDRPADHGPPNRYDIRGPPTDYGRSDRHSDPVRQREASPGRHGRPMPSGRTPERMHVTDHRDWSGRDARDYDDRAMRGPQRDRAPPVRPPSGWDSRDTRDPRDQRERPDSRGHPGPPSMETRRMPPSSSQAAEYAPHRREPLPLQSHHGSDRGDAGASRPLPAVPQPSADGPMVNPARAALIHQNEQARPESVRSDRDSRRERGTRPQSPRRAEDRREMDRPPPGYHGRADMPREHRDDRELQTGPPVNRDRRDEPTVSTPTGPRGGRPEPVLPASAPRETFQPPQPPRSSSRQNQDPNYGRLNQPSEAIPPSGPRSDSTRATEPQGQHMTWSNERPHTQGQPPMPPSGPAASLPPGIHPSRLENIQRVPAGPAVQTNLPMVPSGPRGPGGAQGGPPPSPVNRGPPTGPAANDRGLRGNDRRNPLGAINNVLTQNAPTSERSSDRSAVPPQNQNQNQNPQVRGRGATRANGMVEGHGEAASPMPPPSHPSTPNSYPEGQHGRSGRAEHPSSRIEGAAQDDSRTEPRTHRESRRSGRDRSRSPDRNDRRTDERSSRNGPTDKPPRVEGEDRNGRERRGGEREGSSRRDRERGESDRSNREPRESGRRDRGSRDDGRASGRDERDRRSRGGGSSGAAGPGADDGRKRTRDPQDQGQHGDLKRRR